jgi:outer membrane protein TolC
VVSEENNIAYTGAIRVQQPIFTGGRIWFNYKSMQSQHDEARLNEEQFVQEILLNTEKAYFTLLKTQERLLIAEAHRVAVAEQLSDMEKRYKYGRVNLNDLLKSRVQLADADSELLKAKNGVLVAEGQMNLLLNRPLEQPVKAVSVGDPPQVTLSSAAAKELAKLANKALNSARQKRLTAEFQRRIAEADYYPSISFTGQYNAQGGMANYRDTWWFAGISLEWNIWQWGGTRSKVNAAKAFERQVEYDVSSLENKTVIEVRDAYLLISEADQRVIADRESVKQAEENLRITKIGYQSGRNTATELLKAEDLVVQAKGTLVQDMYEAHVSRAQLRFIMGKMESLDFLTFRTIEPATEEKRPAPAVPVQQDRAAVPAQPGDTLYAEAAE